MTIAQIHLNRVKPRGIPRGHWGRLEDKRDKRALRDTGIDKGDTSTAALLGCHGATCRVYAGAQPARSA